MYFFPPNARHPGKFFGMTKGSRLVIASEARQSTLRPHMDCRVACTPRNDGFPLVSSFRRRGATEKSQGDSSHAFGMTEGWNDGFSLVELSIVLVILGLLVGGILTGQNLIKAAELRSVTTEFQQYQTAVNLFQEKYFALPGDMGNATAFWNDEGNCAAVEANTHLDPLEGGTCDGDGNGLVTNYWNNYYEASLFWHHLQLAELISGQYTGVRGAGAVHHLVIGENAPRAKFSNGGWTGWSWNDGHPEIFDLDCGNAFAIGAQHSSSLTRNPLLTPEEAWNIDTKIDDGKSGQGSVIAFFWNNACANAASNTDYDADYRLSDDTVQCGLIFRNGM